MQKSCVFALSIRHILWKRYEKPFFKANCSVSHKTELPPEGDFIVDNNFLFEVGVEVCMLISTIHSSTPLRMTQVLLFRQPCSRGIF